MKLLEKVKSYNPSADLDLIKRAYEFAEKAHASHKRLSGDPYIIHPLAVAEILADLEQDVVALAAALLHDTIEDAEISSEQLKETFGEEITKLVEGVTKLGQLTFVTKVERQAENFRKMFVAMAEDLRIIVIKLADRLHNMQTIQYLPPLKQKETSLETREIFAPLAHRLGMWRIKWELEDLAFNVLEPKKYNEIKEKIAEARVEREAYIKDFIEKLSEQLSKVGLTGEIQGRPKHFYSIYRKMVDQNLEFSEIYDLTAVRILVDSVKDCYAVLGVIHAAWKPIPGRFRDYIAVPKSNGYQSLHTTVIGPEGRPIEIQIRTCDMHRVAEYGVAAHWRYKEISTDKALDLKMSWLRHMLEWQSELKDAKDFMESLKIDLFTDEVFVFTPKGDVFGLPVDSTPIDFAYRVHTEVGHRSIGAKINGRIVPLDHKLKSGDIIEIITSKKDNPSIDWLSFVKTAGARAKIKSWIKKARGEELPPSQPSVLAAEAKEIKPRLVPRPHVKPSAAVMVSGLENILVRFSRCCCPIPPEEIVGYVSHGRGVNIHKKDCPNIVDQELPRERMVKVEWNPKAEMIYPVEIEIEAFDRLGVLKDILGEIAETGTNVSAAKISTKRGSSAFLSLTVDVKDLEHLNKITQAIRRVSDVYEVARK